jgi:RND family efflux transporter MFP subunit
MPVVQLAEWSRLRLVVPVPESAVPELRLGNVVQVHVSAMNRNFDGKIARFADALDEETRTMHTEIDVENPSGVLKDGMYADAKIVLEQHNNALTVPVQALDRNGSGVSVLIVDAQSRVEPREIKLGIEGSDRAEVLSGISENERVIVGNRGAFHTGEKVLPKVVNDSLEAEGS